MSLLRATSAQRQTSAGKQMRHASLEQIKPLLEMLRANRALEEVRALHFEVKGEEFLHFHDYPHGVVADVRLANRSVRLGVSSASEHAELLAHIEDCLETGRLAGAGSRASAREEAARLGEVECLT
jgi:DNA-binding ferritin-like protein